MDTQSVNETIAQACRVRPVLKPFLESFAPLLSQRRATAERLAPLLVELASSLRLSPASLPMLRHGIPDGLENFIPHAAEDLLPLLLAQPAIAPHKKLLEELFLTSGHEREHRALLEAMVSDSPDQLIAIAEKFQLDPQILEFACGFIVSAVFRALASAWSKDEFSEWRKNICPVCASPPVIAWLGKKPFSANNEFLSDGGGKKHLHCGLCGTDWHFLRGVCPSCGTQGKEAMQILGEEDRRHERIDWCEKCHAYLPQIDLRELADTPDMDAMALCLMHLDLVAAEKELIPLKPSFWNMF